MAEFVEIIIEAGSDFTTDITVTDDSGQAKSLANTTPKAQMRKSYYSSTAVNFQIEVDDPTTGIFTMSIDAANTANIRAGRYVYDVVLYENNGDTTRIFEGIATVTPGATKP